MGGGSRVPPHRVAGMNIDLDSLGTAVLAVDEAGRIVCANAAAEQLTGLSRVVLLGLAASQFFPEIPGWLEWFRGKDPSQRASFSQPQTLHFPQSPGVTRRVRLTVGCLASGGGLLLEMSGYEAMLLAEQQEQQAGLSEASRQLLRNLAHEIKNPLGGIRGAAQLLGADLADPAQRECIEVIIGETDRLQNLVDRLLAPYRGKLRLETVNVHEVLERVRQLLAAEFPKGLSVVRDYDVSAPAVQADRERLLQVFLNLARNAAEALGDRRGQGDAVIRLVTRVRTGAVIGPKRLRLALEVHVEDNGPGIPPALKDKIFYPLVTGRENGSGLGLSLAQNFIRQMGGAIDVASRPGRTDFCVLLPASAESP